MSMLLGRLVVVMGGMLSKYISLFVLLKFIFNLNLSMVLTFRQNTFILLGQIFNLNVCILYYAHCL